MHRATNIEKITYRGWVHEARAEDNYEALIWTLVPRQYWDWKDSAIALAQLIKNDMQKYGNYLSVRYYILGKEFLEEEMLEEFMKYIHGFSEAKYLHHYSEITGYLWTDEDIIIGGHHLIEELSSYKGHFCHLEIIYLK